MRLTFYFSLLLLAISASPALEIRNYTPARHDRFVTQEGSTVPNPNAFYFSTRYTAVGYAPGGGQFALITPQHVLFARHFAPPLGFAIRFRNNLGQELTRTVTALIDVPNGSGGIADVHLLQLSTPISPDQGITPLPYLNLANEALYNGTVITLFGNTLRAGRGVISGFTDFSDPTIDTTRVFTSSYSNFGTNPDDAYAEVGDSGSPTFATVNGTPALVAVHLAAGSTPFGFITLDSFIPEYAPAINTLLAPEGYALIPANTPTIALSTALTTTPHLRQADPASISLTLRNTSGNTATNPRLNLLLATTAIPTSVTAPPGWIVENPSPGEYRLRSATLSGNSSTTATISYSSIPTLLEIPIQATHTADGSTPLTQTFTLPVTETFGGFVAGLTLPGALDDPDLDGIPNLLEYALGGNPRTNSTLAESGQPLAPQTSGDPSTLTFTHTRRTDATARGLTYQTEFSQTLEATSWSTTPPTGATSTTAPLSPDIPGFEQVTITLPTTPERTFLRLKVTLDESPPP